MSREIDMNDSDSWDEDDVLYLAQRGQLPTDVMSHEDQRSMLDQSAPSMSLTERANTGTVNTANLSIEELEAELERRRAEHDETDTQGLMTNFGGLQGATADDEEVDEEPLEPPYDQYNKGDLSAEIDRRNRVLLADDEEADVMPLSGSKQELVERLEADDAENAE